MRRFPFILVHHMDRLIQLCKDFASPAPAHEQAMGYREQEARECLMVAQRVEAFVSLQHGVTHEIAGIVFGSCESQRESPQARPGCFDELPELLFRFLHITVSDADPEKVTSKSVVISKKIGTCSARPYSLLHTPASVGKGPRLPTPDLHFPLLRLRRIELRDRDVEHTINEVRFDGIFVQSIRQRELPCELAMRAL